MFVMRVGCTFAAFCEYFNIDPETCDTVEDTIQPLQLNWTPEAVKDLLCLF